MTKNLLLISTLQENGQNFFWPLFEELANQDYRFFLCSNCQEWQAFFKDKKWYVLPILFWPKDCRRLNTFLFWLLYPLYLISSLPLIIFLKLRKKADYLILFNQPEKLVITPLAKLLGLKVFWLECPPSVLITQPSTSNWLFRWLGNNSTIITFNNFTKTKLTSSGIRLDKITVIKPGLNIGQLRHQENIFDRLATSEQLTQPKKFFTVGTIACSSERHCLETLFQAGQKSLTVIPNLQIIVLGGNEDKNNLSWLAKKLEIENIVWLVGEQINLGKWLKSFDIFIITTSLLKLEDMNLIIRTMVAGLPIIGPRDIGLEDFVYEDKNGILVQPGNSEVLAQAIIKLQQSQRLRTLFGEQAQKISRNEFSLVRSVENWSQLFS